MLSSQSSNFAQRTEEMVELLKSFQIRNCREVILKRLMLMMNATAQTMMIKEMTTERKDKKREMLNSNLERKDLKKNIFLTILGQKDQDQIAKLKRIKMGIKK
jgi:hypothetical protein